MLDIPRYVWMTASLIVYGLSMCVASPCVAATTSSSDDCTGQCNKEPPKRSLSCPNAGIRWVPSSDNCSKVFGLNLENNQITCLQGGDFDSFPEVETISLKGNTISEISDGAFYTSRGIVLPLNDLYLDDNKLKSLSSNALGQLTLLKKLSLNGNQLDGIQHGIFNNLGNVTKLHLASNSIRYIQKESFTGMINLTHLCLGSNRISQISNRTFRGLIRLEELDLSNNTIQLLEAKAFEDLSQLKNLNLSSNNIVSVWAIYDLRHIGVLDLSFNNITTLNEYLNKVQLQSSNYNISINVSSNPLHCDCFIKSLRSWYVKARPVSGGNIARCSSPDSVAGEPLAEVAEDVICPGITTTLPTLRTTYSANVTRTIARSVSETPVVGWTQPVLGILLGLLCFGMLLAVMKISYRKYKHHARGTARQMSPARLPVGRPPRPLPRPPPALARSPSVSPRRLRPPARLPARLPARPPPRPPAIVSGPSVTSRREFTRRRLPSFLQVRDYITRLNSHGHPLPPPPHGHVITNPSSPSAGGNSSQPRVYRVPSFSNHTAHHHYSNVRSGFADHLPGCQVHATAQFSDTISCTCSYLSVHGTDSLLSQPRRPPRPPRSPQPPRPPRGWPVRREKHPPERSHQLDPLLPDVAPDTPEIGLKLDRQGNVRILPFKEFSEEKRISVSWSNSGSDHVWDVYPKSPKHQSGLYISV